MHNPCPAKITEVTDAERSEEQVGSGFCSNFLDTGSFSNCGASGSHLFELNTDIQITAPMVPVGDMGYAALDHFRNPHAYLVTHNHPGGLSAGR